MCASLASRLDPPAVVRVPGAHLGLSWRRVGEADKPALRQLTQETEQDSKVVRTTPVKQLDALVDQAVAGRDADALVGVDQAGRVQAFGLVRLYREDREVARAELYAATMPKWRGRGIGRALLNWQDGRARQLLVERWGADATLPARISNVVEAQQRDRRQLYAAGGYCPADYIGVYRCDLTETLPPLPPRAPEVVPWRDDLRDQVRVLHQAKAHAQGASYAQAGRWWKRVNAALDADLSFLAIADGIVSAYALVCRHSSDWRAGTRSDASIEAYGPGPGVALDAVFAATMANARARGMSALSTEVKLRDVNDTAPHLEALGFHRLGVRMVYTVDM